MYIHVILRKKFSCKIYNNVSLNVKHFQIYPCNKTLKLYDLKTYIMFRKFV